MNTKEAKLLLEKTVIMIFNDHDNLGTVLKLSPTGFLVDWQDGQRGWIDYRDAQEVELYQPKRKE